MKTSAIIAVAVLQLINQKIRIVHKRKLEPQIRFCGFATQG